MNIRFEAVKTARVEIYRAAGVDENGQVPEVAVSDGSGNPCRHCLTEIPKGQKMLVLAFRPEQRINPYAEVGPVFLCADPCQRHPSIASLPDMFRKKESLLVRGYNRDGRIVYGTGRVTAVEDVEARATALFADERVEYIHLRSSSNNCYQCKIIRQR